MSDDDCCEIVVPVRRKRRPQQRDDHLHKQEAMITKSAVRPCPRKQVLDSPQQSSLQSNSPPINNDFIEVTKVAEEPDNPFASFAFGEEGIALKSLPAKKRRAGDAPSLWKPQESSTDTTKTTGLPNLCAAWECIFRATHVDMWVSTILCYLFRPSALAREHGATKENSARFTQ